MKKTAVSFLLLIVACMILGCDSTDPNRPKTYKTTITVMLDGQPVEGASVTLASADPGVTNSSYGKTDASGVCKLTTYDPEDGVVPGKYEVRFRKSEILTEPDPSEDDPNGTKVVGENFTIPEKYGSASPDRMITVTEEGPNEFSFDLQSK